MRSFSAPASSQDIPSNLFTLTLSSGVFGSNAFNESLLRLFARKVSSDFDTWAVE